SLHLRAVALYVPAHHHVRSAVSILSLPRRPPESSTLSLLDALPIFGLPILALGVMVATGFAAAGRGLQRSLLGHHLPTPGGGERSEEHTSELQSRFELVCLLLLEKKKQGVARRKKYACGRRLCDAWE